MSRPLHICENYSTIFFCLINLDVSSAYQSTATTLIAVVGAVICLVALIKWHFGGGVCKSKARLDGK